MQRLMWQRGMLVAVALTAAATWSAAIDANVAPDGITRATTFNSHGGDVAVLTDGLVPPASTAVFEWNSKGVLIFEWGDVVSLAAVRMRIGGIANDYQIRAYIGGRMQEEGATRDPEGQRTATVEDFSRLADDWLEIVMPEGTRADNIELRNFGPVQLHEVQILRLGATVVEQQSWARIKLAQRPD